VNAGDMQYIREKLYPSSVQRKVIIGFMLTFVAILLALVIAHYSFRDVMDTVDDLSVPNEKLAVLNQVFQEITTLDQLQRAEAIRNPRKPYRAFLNESQALIAMIDSLGRMQWDSTQQLRIMAMKEVLQNRDKVFFAYLKQKSELASNARLARRIDTLSNIINENKMEVDTSVITTQKKTITTYLPDTLKEKKKDERSFLSRLFSKKKAEQPAETTTIKVQEELSVSVDTLAIAKHDNALEEVEKIMRDLETDQRTQSRKLLKQELELIHANTLFINELLSILHDVENEELAKMRANNDHAATLMNQSISRIILLLFVFFVGGALIVYLVWIDISKSNYYKEQLEKAKDEAEELTKIKQRFLANMSHEIRTPLQSIIGFAEHIKGQSTVDAEAVDAIHSSSEHLLHIVNEVLDYSRISSGNLTLEKEPFGLLPIVREVEAAIRIQSQKKNLTFLLETDEMDYTLLGDSFRLRQILYNLLGNAIKFTQKGYVKLAVRTIPNLSSVRCFFEISDTGIGIQPDDLKKIFNQFEQANTSIARQYGGTGLGLTIVKSLVEAQGGELEADSQPGQGSVFTVELVYQRITLSQHQQLKKVSAASSGHFTGKVIVVDDDAMILKLCGLMLTRHHIQHTLYSEAEKLLNEPVDEAVTHILMDIRMPHINGVELCRALKKTYDRRVTYVALTAHVLPEEQQELLNEGFDRVLSKPFREEELAALFGIHSAPEIIAPKNPANEINLAVVRQMTFGDENLFQSVIHQFLQDTESDLVRLEQQQKNGDLKSMREIVHKLSGRIGQMGVPALSGRLHLIEKRIDDGETLQALLPEIREISNDVAKMVDALREMTLEKA
jgi:signal transduction histidine kinase/FixJ family two-component response regulator